MIYFTCDRTRYRIDQRAILYIETKRNGTIIHTHRNMYSTRRPLSEWETILNRRLFFKCHEGYLINLDCVTGHDRKSVTMKNGDTLQVSKRRSGPLYQAVFAFREGTPECPLKGPGKSENP